MNKAELNEMKEDRLANFAVAAFLGSLLMGQAWEMWEGSEGTAELLMFTVPDYWGLVILACISGFFVLSLFLATASMVTPLQRWGLAATRLVAPIMLPIVSVSFISSWSSSTLELPNDQWWVTSSIHWRIRNVPVHRVQTYTDLLVQVSTSESPTNYRI